MAETFSIDPGQPVQQGANAMQQAPQQSVQSVAQGPVAVQPAGPSSNGLDGRTMDALLKLGSDVLAPKVKQAAQEQFMEGVNRAMTGEAIKDIVESRPWWAEAFGPSSAVQGARAYTVAQTVAQFGADMESQMPILAQEDSSVLTKKVNELMGTLTTGDAAADMAITSQIVDQMAPLYKRHAKEHVAYQQGKASDLQVDTWTKLGAAYQSRAAAFGKGDGTVTAEDMKAEQGRLLGSLNPFADQPDESYDRNMARFLNASAAQGNFQVISFFKDQGLIDKLPPEFRSQLQAGFRSGGRQALDKAMPQFAVDVALATRDMAQNPAGIPARIAALNEKAAKVTGVPLEYASLIPPGQIDNLVGNVLTSQAASQAAAQREAAGIAMSNQMLGVQGGVGPCKSIGLCKEAHIEQAALTQWNQDTDPARRAALLNNNATETFGGIKSNLSSMLNTKEDTPGVQAVGKLYSSLNEESKGRYFSADDQKLLDRYTQMVNGGEAPAAAWQVAKVVAPMAKFYLDPKEKDATAKAIRSWVESNNENFLGWNNITDPAMNTAQMVVSSVVANGRAGNGIDRAVKRAMSDAVTSGRLQIVGEHAVIGDYSRQTPLVTLLSQGKDSMGADAAADTFNHVLKDKFDKLDVDMGDYQILRTDDKGGKAMFMVEAVGKKGQVSSFTITSDELRATYASGLVKARAKSEAFKAAVTGTPQTQVVDTGFGPTIVPR
jgi:hypothetical protein